MMGKKKMRRVLSILRDTRRSATMEDASFEFPGQKLIDEQGKKRIPTEYIKEKTRSFRYSWIEHPIDKVIAMIEEELVK